MLLYYCWVWKYFCMKGMHLYDFFYYLNQTWILNDNHKFYEHSFRPDLQLSLEQPSVVKLKNNMQVKSITE